MFRITFGPNLAPKAPDNFFQHTMGGKSLFSPDVCTLKMLRVLWGIQMCMQNMRGNLTLTSLTQPPKPGCSDQSPWGLEFFFKTPTYVFIMISAIRVSI